MTPQQYQSALSTLSLTPDQAAVWLGIGRSTAYRYLKTGCEGAVEMALNERLDRTWRTIESAPMDGRDFFAWNGNRMLVMAWDTTYRTWDNHNWESVTHWLPFPLPPSHSDLTAAVGLPG